MNRKTKILVIETEGRDRDKRFLLTEMPAAKIEKWGWRATMALLHSGVDIPQEMQGAGMAAIVAVGFSTLLKCLSRAPWGEIEPLLDELLTCVQFIPDPAHPERPRPLGIGGAEDVEEASTFLLLRSEVFELHTGFSVAGAIRGSMPAETMGSSASAATIGKSPASRDTRTSRRRSERRSRAV